MRYQNVVMVDDLKKNLRSVDDAMHRAQIPFVGAHYPLVAIGGINAARLPAVHASGVDGIAMISALTCSPDPVATARDFMALTGHTTSSPRHTGLGQILSPIAEPQPG